MVTKLTEEQKARLRTRLKSIREKKKTERGQTITPKVIYDDVYFEGLKWLNTL